MKKTNRRIIATVLSVAIMGSIISGCQSTQQTKKASTEGGNSSNIANTASADYDYKNFKASKPETFTMLYNNISAYPYKADWLFWKKLKEKTNVSLKLTVVDSADYNDKRSVLIAAGNAPEIMPKSYAGSEDKFVTSGQLLPISDYANNAYMPNFCSEVKTWGIQSDVDQLKQRDGKIYCWPELHQSINTDYSLVVRTDLLKKNNIEMPESESWNDIETILKQFKKLYPNVIPWSDNYKMDSTLGFAGPAFGTGAAGEWSSGNSLYYDKKSDKFVFTPTMSQYKDMLIYFNRLVNEGLLDKSSLTQSSDKAEEKFINGKSFMMAANSQEVVQLRTKMDGTIGKGKYEIKKINVPSGPAGSYITASHLENGIMISSKAKNDPNFKDLMHFVDWLYFSYNGQEFCKWGVEGQTFTKENDTYKLTSDWKLPAYNKMSSNPKAKDLRQNAGFGNGVFILSYGGPDALAKSCMSQEDIDFNTMVNKTHKVLENAPKYYYDEDTQEQQNLLNSTLTDYYISMTDRFILGQASITKDWNSYVTGLNNKGMQKYVDTANEAYQNTKSGKTQD